MASSLPCGSVHEGAAGANEAWKEMSFTVRLVISGRPTKPPPPKSTAGNGEKRLGQSGCPQVKANRFNFLAQHTLPHISTYLKHHPSPMFLEIVGTMCPLIVCFESSRDQHFRNLKSLPFAVTGPELISTWFKETS